jgi:hypothetical protein
MTETSALVCHEAGCLALKWQGWDHSCTCRGAERLAVLEELLDVETTMEMDFARRMQVRAERAESERDAARAEVERLKEIIDNWGARDPRKIEAELEQVKAERDNLRALLPDEWSALASRDAGSDERTEGGL